LKEPSAIYYYHTSKAINNQLGYKTTLSTNYIMVRTKDLKAPMNNRFDVLKEPEKTRSSEFTKRPRGGISSGMRRRSKRAESAAASSKPNEFRMQHSAFPELGKSQSAASQENATNMNFAEATKPEESPETS